MGIENGIACQPVLVSVDLRERHTIPRATNDQPVLGIDKVAAGHCRRNYRYANGQRDLRALGKNLRAKGLSELDYTRIAPDVSAEYLRIGWFGNPRQTGRPGNGGSFFGGMTASARFEKSLTLPLSASMAMAT